MKLNLTIEGMHCGSCVRHVTLALQKVEGVEAPTVGGRDWFGLRELRPEKASEKEIVDAVNGIGFTATPPDSAATAQASLPVKGMTCAACQSFVQRTLESQPGVRSASVNLMMERATVDYDPLTVSPQSLVDAINGTGYEASLPEPGRSATAEQDEQEREHESAYRRLLLQMAGALAAAVVAMTLSMPLMRHGSVDPVMHRIAMWLGAPVQAMFPWLYTLPVDTLRWTLLVLATLVMVLAGRRFYVKAWAAARTAPVT